MKKITNRGFTLIELLVVIAIIGILASIILVSLGSARNKGKDARLLNDVNQTRNQIESEANSSGTYAGAGASGTTCLSGTPSTINASSPNCSSLLNDANGNIPPGGTTLSVKTTPSTGTNLTSYTAYSVYAQLNGGGFYCVDSTGNAKTEAVGWTPAVTC